MFGEGRKDLDVRFGEGSKGVDVIFGEGRKDKDDAGEDELQEVKLSPSPVIMGEQGHLVVEMTEHEDYYSMDVEQIAERFQVDLKQGLSTEAARLKLITHGNNELKGQSKSGVFRLLFTQIANTMTLVLLAAMIISFVAKDYVEGTVIVLIVVANTVIGFLQEFKAEKTMDSLRKTAFPTAHVIRDAVQVRVSTIDLVPGDILLLKNGDSVGADGRIFESQILSIDEALLTGETHPVDKNSQPISERDVVIGDQINMAFASTVVTQGRAKAIVVRTGMETEIGKIAKHILSSEHGNPKTPLQCSLDRMALVLLFVAAVLVVVVFGVNGFSYNEAIALFAIAVAIAVIPEGLTAIVTLTMAMGVRTMAKQRVLVRKLSALEALGMVTNICSDKTGTLTQAKMAVTSAWIPTDVTYSIEANGFDPNVNQITRLSSKSDNAEHTSIPGKSAIDNGLELLGKCASLCNMAEIRHDTAKDQWNGIGDPTEIALQVFASKLNLGKPQLVAPGVGYSLWVEHVFDSLSKRMAVIFKNPIDGSGVVFAKGSTERILERCKFVRKGSDTVGTTLAELERMVNPILAEFAGNGKRIISLAMRYLPDITSIDAARELSRESVESDLVFLGLLGLDDPPRPESKPSIEQCHLAGITVHILTGDHPLTALAIARQVGINLPPDHKLITSAEFDGMTDQQIDDLAALPPVIARCSPQTKVRMIQALHRRGCIVAMTGDGVNDSPSLKFADIGVAMGQAGSDVAKQASDIVLTDDNFASIVGAIAQGRRIFRNIQRFVSSLIGGNVAELVALIIGLVLFRDDDGFPVFPMSPVQILVNNMVTGTPAALALSMEKAGPGAMKRPPRPSKMGLFDGELIGDILFYGLVVGLISFFNFVIVVVFIGDGNFGRDCSHSYNDTCFDVFRGRGVCFATLTTILLLHTYNCRDIRGSVWNIDGISRAFENVYIPYSVCTGMAVVFISLYVPYLNQEVFKHSGFDIEWLLVIASTLVFIAISEAYKFGKRRFLQPLR
uniref:P-type sodium-transporting ATPase4 n=1 Tax=Spongospora subterranea TaxID=70186 RepID=A0A0H5RQD3_9EUKA|eukprot:CRZ10919.1 hypothetical protein [Spongospora subterranea]